MTVTIEEAQLGDKVPIARGATAVVHNLPDLVLPEAPASRWVYKRYRTNHRPTSSFGLEKLVRLRHDMPDDQRRAVDFVLNWPVRVVVDDERKAAGVVLPLLADEYFLDLRLSSGTTRRKGAEGQFLFMEADYCARVKIPFPTRAQRLQLCRSLAYAFGLLDRADVVYGDLSSRNFLFRLRPRPAVMVVDCDAVRVSRDASALGSQPHTPEWEPPEALRAKSRRDATGYSIQSKQTDRYKLGLAVLRILSPGPGCSTNRDPLVVGSILPKRLWKLLDESLSEVPSERPTGRDWYEEFIR